MLAAAIILYILASLAMRPFWPLAMLGGKAGPLRYVLAATWVALLLGGMN